MKRWTIYVCDEGHVHTEPYWHEGKAKCRHGLALTDFVDAHAIEVVPEVLLTRLLEAVRKHDSLEHDDPEDLELYEVAREIEQELDK